MTDELAICERLEAEEEVFQGSFRFVNPDGPEAAAIIRECAEALELAVSVIEEERQITVDCNTVLYRASPDLGKVVDPEAVAQIETYDTALNAGRAILAKVRTPHHSDDGGRS